MVKKAMLLQVQKVAVALENKYDTISSSFNSQISTPFSALFVIPTVKAMKAIVIFFRAIFMKG